MKKVVISGLLFLLVRGSVSQGIIDKSGHNRPMLATPSVATAKDAQEGVDYLSVLRGALARGFASIPSSVKFKLFSADVSPECRVGLLRTLRGFMKLEPWILRLFDASAMYPTGLLQVSRANMGAFDECLETVVPDKSGNLLTRGQYCNVVAYIKNGTAVKGAVEAMADILHPKLQYFKDYFTVEGATLCRLGVCFIKECGQHDLQALIDSLNPPSMVRVQVSNCVTAEPEPWTATQIAITSFLGFLVALIISATTTDYIIRTRSRENEKKSTLIQFVLAFSATSNTRDLLRMADKANADQYAMQFLHGLRFACLVHIVMGHFYTNLSDSWSSFLTIFAISDEWNHMFAAAVFNSVSTFFFSQWISTGL
uniref:Receptor mediated endocytosis n=1 Tax=Rhipicephalus zambeziensis TaxID=60191 RepID=A0A224Z361_9ACAR